MITFVILGIACGNTCYTTLTLTLIVRSNANDPTLSSISADWTENSSSSNYPSSRDFNFYNFFVYSHITLVIMEIASGNAFCTTLNLTLIVWSSAYFLTPI